MNLHFLDNTTQRQASKGKVLPTRSVEAMMAYGTGPQRARVVHKVMENAEALCSQPKTHHIMVSLVEGTDATTQCELLYKLRNKLPEFARTKWASVVVRKLAEKAPSRQKREIALAVAEEFVSLSCHPVGNFTLQTIVQQPEGLEELEEKIQENTVKLATHEYGQCVLAKYLEHAPEDKAQPVIDAVMEKIEDVLDKVQDSRVLHIIATRFGTKAVLKFFAENFELFLEGNQHVHALIAAITKMSPKMHAKLLGDVAKRIEDFTEMKDLGGVTAAFAKSAELTLLKPVIDQLVGALPDALQHPTQATILKVLVEREDAGTYPKLLSSVTKAVAGDINEVLKNGSACSVAVKLMNHAECRKKLMPYVTEHFAAWITDRSATHVAQAAVRHADAPTVSKLVDSVLDNAVELCQDGVGTFALQVLIEKATPEQLARLVELVVEDMENLCTHPTAAFTLRALLKAVKGIPDTRKPLVQSLKPYVTRMSTSPTGRLVLDALLGVCRGELQNAIKNVIFVKLENRLTPKTKRPRE